MRKPRCVIVGMDGFDPDVLANLISFYRGCGFAVAIAAAPEDCDLLVIQRGRYDQKRRDTRASRCHIYDYAALGTSDFHLAFPAIAECIVISPHSAASGESTPPHRVRGFHPVIPELWRPQMMDDRPRPQAFVHIGHRKPNPTGDAALLQMDEIAAGGRCDFFGAGWSALAALPAGKMHGAVSLHDSQRIYRHSVNALGIMYPFQRGRTISGRMWQAPLNGCRLFSEAVMDGVLLPGVEYCRDFPGLLNDPPAPASPRALRDAAADFWRDSTRRLAERLDLNFRRPNFRGTQTTYLKWVYLRHLQSRMRWLLPAAA